jgi:hypothetical protein
MNLPGRANVNVPLDVPLILEATPCVADAALLGAFTSRWTKVPCAECTWAMNVFNCSVPLAKACEASNIEAPKTTALTVRLLELKADFKTAPKADLKTDCI